MSLRRSSRLAEVVSAALAIASPKKLIAICNDPSCWHCSACGSTDSLLLSLDKLEVCCTGNERCGQAAAASSTLWLSLDPPFCLYDGKIEPTNIGTDVHLARTIARLRAALRDLKALGGSAWECAHGWARVRLAVKLFGTPFLSRKSQLQRMQKDIRATAVRKWVHADIARAFRSWKEYARTADAETASNGPDSVLPQQTTSHGRATAKRRRGGLADSEEDACASNQSVVPTSTPMVDGARPTAPGRTRTQVPCGLRNLGNTCYMNSSMQLVVHLLGLRAPLVALRPVTSLQPTPALYKQLSQVDGRFDATRLQPTAPDSLPPLHPPRLMRLNSGVADLFEDAGGMPLTVDAGKQPLLAAVHEVLTRLRGGDEALAVFSPDAFLKRMWLSMPRFSGYRQHDAEEWCRALLSALDAELSPPPAPQDVSAARGPRSKGGSAVVKLPPPVSPLPPPLIASIVGGEILSTVTCHSCDSVSATTEPFFGPLSVEIPVALRKCRGSCKLEDCLQAAFSDETLEGDAAYACERCRRKCTATKSRRLARLPPVLMLHIIRTDWAAGGRKVTTTVVPPLHSTGKDSSSLQLLDLKPWIVESDRSVQTHRRGTLCASTSLATAPPINTLYELRSVVEHQGSAMGKGHYVNYSAEGPATPTHAASWWQFNDARVSRATLTEVAAAQAYILGFEQRRIT